MYALQYMLRRLPADRSKQFLGFFHEVVRRCPDEGQLLPSTGGDDQECSNWGEVIRRLTDAFEDKARTAGHDFIVDGAPVYPSPNREAVWPIAGMESRASEEQLKACCPSVVDIFTRKFLAMGMCENPATSKLELPNGLTWHGMVYREWSPEDRAWIQGMERACGRGRLTKQNAFLETNTVYIGEVEDGRPHGEGTSYEADGCTLMHAGYFVNGEPLDNCVICMEPAGFGAHAPVGQVAVLGCADGEPGCKVRALNHQHAPTRQSFPFCPISRHASAAAV